MAAFTGISTVIRSPERTIRVACYPAGVPCCFGTKRCLDCGEQLSIVGVGDQLCRVGQMRVRLCQVGLAAVYVAKRSVSAAPR